MHRPAIKPSEEFEDSADVPPQHAPPDLVSLVAEFCEAATLGARNVALIRLIHWTRGDKRSHRNVARLAALVEYLESDAPVRLKFQSSFGSLLAELHCISLFAEAGIPSDHTFRSEIMQRIIGRVIPAARAESDAARLLVTLYSSERDVRSFLATPAELLQRLIAVLTPADTPNFWRPQQRDLQEALRLLAARVSGIGLEPEMRDRSTSGGVSDSPFYRLVKNTDDLLGDTVPEDLVAAVGSWRDVVDGCRLEMAQVHRHMESAGVSVELIFDLKKIEACLLRMSALVDVLAAGGAAEQTQAVQTLLGHLIEGRLSDRSIHSLLRENLNLIARKMVERTGHSGEHYIASNRAEYWQMWRAAAGGGLLTVITAALKMRIVDAHLPPFVEGFASGTNYAISFVLLQVFGLVLATKQPAATAATFAGIIRNNRGVERSSKLTDFVARITSTQLAAAIGNVVFVSLGAVLFEVLWSYIFTESYLPPESATHVYETLHPFASGTAFYAIVTGVILWLAALAGGWFENFAVYYRFTDAVAQHPLGLRIGKSWMGKIATVLENNLGGWSTSIVLGYLLGFTPVFGRFFGIPLDVRHVTLSTGTLALAAARYGTWSLGRAWFYHAVEGIAVIFVLNLFVSFTIAAFVALRAYDVRPAEQFQILRFLCADAVKSPLRFVWPSFASDAGAPQREQGHSEKADVT
jgi:site-specific recombinase